MAQVTKFIFGRNYMLFGVSNGESVNYYMANGLDDVEGDRSRDVDVWSEALSSSVRRLVDIGTSPLRYAAADQACDIYLPDVDIGLSGACQLEGAVYSMSLKTCADFVHPDDFRQYVGLSGPVGDSTHEYSLCCSRTINSYLYRDVSDVVCSSDFSEYADYDGFVRLQQQLEYLQRYVSDRFYSVSKSFYGGIDSSAALSNITYEKYITAAESMGVEMAQEDKRYARMVIDEYLEQLASPEFNGSLSWRRQSKLLYSVFCRLVSKYLNASTVTQIFSDIDDVLAQTYEDVLYTENAEQYRFAAASVNDVNLNTDVTYSFADVFAAARQTTVADTSAIQSSYGDALRSYFDSCIGWCDRLMLSARNLLNDVLNGVKATTAEQKTVNDNIRNTESVYVMAVGEYAIIKALAGCSNCGSWKSSVKKSVNANMQTLLSLYDYYTQLYSISKDYFIEGKSHELTQLDTQNVYSLGGGDGRTMCAARQMYVGAESYNANDEKTGYQMVASGVKCFYCDDFDIKKAFQDLRDAVDFKAIRYRTATAENFNERTYIKQGTLKVVTEVAQGHVLWKRYTDAGTWDVSSEVALSDAFTYVCGNDDRLCAEASYDITFPDGSSQWFCDSYVNVTSSDLSVQQTDPKSQYFYVRGFLERDVDQDNIVTPIKDSYQNVFGQMSAYPYVNSYACGKCGTSSGKTSQKNLCALCRVARSYTDSSVNAFEPFTGTSKKAVDMYKYGGDYDVRICCLYPPGSKYNENIELKDTTVSAKNKSGYKNFYDLLGQEQYVMLSSTDPQYKQIIAELTSGSQTVLENVNTITLYDILSSYAANYKDEKGQSAPKLPVVPNVIATDEDAEKLKDIRISALLSYTNNISDYIGIPLTSMLKGQLRDTQRLDDMLPTFMQYSKNGNNTLWQIYRNTDETGQLEEFTKKSVSKAQKDERIMTLADMSLGNLIDERDYSLSTGYFTTKGVWKNDPSLGADTRGKAIYTKLANFPLYDVLPTDGLDTEAWIGKRKRLRAPNSDGEYMEVADITPHEFAKYDQSVIVAQYDDGKNITGFQPTESTYCYDGRIYQQMTVAAPNAVTYDMIRVDGSSAGVLSSLSAQTDEDGNLTAYKAYYTDRMPYGIAVDEDGGATYAFGCAEVDATNVRYQNWDGSAGKYASAYSMDGGFIYDIDSDQVTSAYGYEREDIKGGTATFLKYDLPDGTDIQTGIPYNGPVYINNELGEPEYEDKTWFGSLIGAIPYGALSSATSYEATVSKVFYKDVLQNYLERADYKDSGKNSTTEYAVMRFDDLLLNNSMAFQPGSDPVSNWMELQFSSSDKASPLYYLMSDNGFLISVNMSGDDMGQVITREYAESTYGKLVGYNITNTSQKGYIYPLQNTVGSVYNPASGIAATETNKKNRFIYNWDTGKFDLITEKIKAGDAKGYWLTFGHNGDSVHPSTRKPLYMNVAELTSDVDYMTTAAGYLCADAEHATETNIPVYLDEDPEEGESDIPNYVAGHTLGFLFDVVNKKYRTNKNGRWSSAGALTSILGIDVDGTTVKYYNKYKTITTTEVVKDWTQFFNCNKNYITASYDWIVSDGTYAYSDRVQLSHKLKDGLYTINGLTSPDVTTSCWQENPPELTRSDSRFRLFGSIMKGDEYKYRWTTLSVNVDASYQGTLTLYINSYAESSWDYTIAFKQGYVPTSLPDDNTNAVASTRGFQRDPNANPIADSSTWKAATYNLTGTASKLICICYRKDGSSNQNLDSGYLALPLTGTATFSVSADGNRLLTSLNYDSANRIITAGYTQISLGSGERLEIKSEGSDENRVYSYRIVKTKTETLDEIDKSSPLVTVSFDFLNDTGKTAVWNVNGPSGTGMKTVTATNYACVSDDPIYIYSAEENKYLLRIDTDGTGQSVPTYSYPPANFPTPRETLADGTLRVVSAGYQWDSAAGRNELVYYFNGVSDPVAYYPKERNICAITCWVPMTGDRAASAPCRLTKYIDQLSAGVDAIFGKRTDGYPDPAQTTFDLFGGTVTKTEATNLQIWNRVQSRNLEKCFVDPDFTLGAPLWQVLSAYVKRISDLDELLAHQPPPRPTLSELIDKRIQPKPELKSVFDQPFYVYAAAYESALMPSIDVKTGTIDLCRTYQPVIRVFCSYSGRKTWIKFDENFNADQSEVEDGDATVQNQNSIRDILQNGWVYLPSNQQVAGEIDDALDASQLAYNEGSTYRKWTANIIQIWVKNSIQVDRLRKSAELKYLPVSFDFNEANPQSWVNLSSYKYPDGVSVLDPLLYEVNPTLPDESRGQNPVEIVRLVNTLSTEVKAGKRGLMPGGGYEELADDPHPMITWYNAKDGTEHQINAEISVVPAYNAKKLKSSQYWLYYNAASLRYRLDDYQQQVQADLSAHSTLILRLYRNYNYLYNIVVESLAQYYSNGFVRDRMYDFLSSIYLELAEDLDMNTDAYEYEVYDGEGNVVSVVDDAVYADNSKVSYLMDALESKYAAKYGEDQEGAGAMRSSLQSSVISAYYASLPDKTMSSEAALDRTVNAVVDGAVAEANVSSYAGSGYVDQANSSVLARMAVEAVKQYRGAFSQDLDLGRQRRMLTEKFGYYSDQFSFSDAQISALKTPVLVYNVNDDGAYVSDLYSGYDITCRLSSVGEPAAGMERQLSDCGYEGSFVSSVTPTSDGRLVYGILSGQSLTTTFKYVSTTKDVDSHGCQVYTISSYVPERYAQMSTFSEYLMHNYSEVSDGVYFDLKDEIVDNMTEIVLSSVLAVWKKLSEEDKDSFEFASYYDSYAQKRSGQLQQSSLVEVPDDGIDYDADLQWGKVKNGRTSSGGVSPEYTLFNQSAKSAAVKSVPSMVSAFKSVEMLAFFKKNVHRYIQNIMDQGYLRDGLNHINNALIREIAAQLTAKLAQNQSYQRRALSVVFGQFAEEYYTNVLGYSTDIFDSKFRRRVRSAVQSGSYGNYVRLKSSLKETIEENVREINRGFYADVASAVRDSYDRALDAAFAQNSAYLDVGAMIGSDMVRAGVAEYVSKNLNTYDYADDALCACAAVEKANQPTYAALSAWLSGSIDSKIRRQVRTVVDSVDPVCAGTSWSSDDRMRAAFADAYAENREQAAEYAVQAFSDVLGRLDDSLSSQYNSAARGIIDSHPDLLSAQQVMSDVVRIGSVLSGVQYNYLVETPLNQYGDMLRRGVVDVNAAVTKVPYDQNYSISTDGTNFSNFRDYDGVYACGNTVYMRYRPRLNYRVQSSEQLCYSGINVSCLASVDPATDKAAKADHIEVLKTMDSGQIAKASHKSNVYSVTIDGTGLTDDLTKAIIRNKVTNIVGSLMPANTQLYDIRVES